MSPASLKKEPSIGTSVAMPQQNNAGGSTTSHSSASSKGSEELAEQKEHKDQTTASKELEGGSKPQQDKKAFVLEGKRLLGIMIALLLSMLLAALDTTIFGMMIPKITEKFNALTLVGSANMLIAGCAIAGIGGGGLNSLCYVTIGDFVPTSKTPIYYAIFEIVWIIAAVAGPLLGGVFADKTGFEWGFYINPCIQRVAITLVILFMRLPRPHGSVVEKLKQIDFIGTFTVVSGVILIQLALIWSGQEYPWKSAAVIISLVLGVILLFAFAVVEWKLAVEPIMPMRLFKSLNARLVVNSQISFGMCFFLVLFYYPLYLAVIRNASAISSGLHLVPCIVSISLVSCVVAVLISRTGTYLSFAWCGLAMVATGLGLLAILGTSSANSMIIGIPIVYGVGIGLTKMSPRLDSLVAKHPDQSAMIRDMLQNQGVIWKADVPVGVRNSLIEAYVKSLHTMYFVFIAFAGLCFVLSLLLKNVPLRKSINDSNDG
ncbi:hypothetical protein GGI25_003242 [Coemansia spiralis]|uniref:Major facilitator superfamily (MFS) profile domain-containing protein n=1 Tax=Coemansia spiralis TaxID=417178 RepID=A0A9W8G8X8_9FUNG|nr:hypothetical protein GGI25_003242 [Coemansia spiralis]